MLKKFSFPSFLLIEGVVIVIVAGLTYLPHLSQATIYRDDWYYTLDRFMGGFSAFPYMFVIDRPIRGYFFEVYYRLFGVEPAPFHTVGFLFRIMMGFGALWLFHLLWPKRRYEALLIATLFVLYPGYTRWLEGYENQPKVVSLFLQCVSFALTLWAIQTPNKILKVLLWISSILSGWIYIALIDYAIGMEVFRFLLIFIVVGREQGNAPIIKKIFAVLRVGFPAFIISGGFLFWRIFIFQNKRHATDINLHLNNLIQNPIEVGFRLTLNLIRSLVNEVVLAWSAPNFQELFALPRKNIFIGLGLALLVAIIVLLARRLIRNPGSAGQTELEVWHYEAVFVGFWGTLAGLMPVILADRYFAFGPFSHYSLPASISAACLLAGMLYFIPLIRIRNTFLFFVLVLAVISQFVAGYKVIFEEQVISLFWHQVVWRAPGIREATGLFVNYPGINYGEDVDAVNGPANFIYHPEPMNDTLPVQYKLYAYKQYPWTAKEFLEGGKKIYEYRSHFGVIDSEYILVFSQPSKDSCVRVVDQRWPWYSFHDNDQVILVGQGSNVNSIQTDVEPPVIKESIFGSEPEHGWCYYFQKAELAVQNEDWDQVLAIEKVVDQLGLQPVDLIEWMPYLQAYAVKGHFEPFRSRYGILHESDFYRVQTCNVLTKMQENGYSFSSQFMDLLDNSICP